MRRLCHNRSVEIFVELPNCHWTWLFIYFFVFCGRRNWEVNAQQCFAVVWYHWIQGYRLPCDQPLRTQLLWNIFILITQPFLYLEFHRISLKTQQPKYSKFKDSLKVWRIFLHFDYDMIYALIFDFSSIFSQFDAYNKMFLGGAKDEHFYFFYRSFQLGLVLD